MNKETNPMFFIPTCFQTYCTFEIPSSDSPAVFQYRSSSLSRKIYGVHIVFASSSTILTMVNPKPKPTPPSAKRTSAAWTPVSRAHQPTSSSLRKIPKYEVSSAAEPETPVRKGAAAQTPKSSTAASRKIATRQQTPQRHISVSTDPSTGTELTRESESQLPLKTKKRSPNSWGKIAARSPAQKKQLSRESSGDIRSVTVRPPTRPSHFLNTNPHTSSGHR